ncbi:MAG TPA: hypothetical protein DCK88_00880 [Lactococcus lactis]|uniref:Uncharacterized protein n=1 Tax=Lactococcus garvieae TaxID=1363 RepID=H2AM40_9LACT|nr:MULTISPECIES: hypothetical protein [Lactococcus]QQB43166.1 hypothetical protein I6H59_00100 [Lactococcus garvieae]CCF55372.1 hypothetical protein [Lactococcus garvieae]CEF52416.1 hypothetical protein LGMT14_02348 [Lactococcus garvieae]HAF56757.1 hypothetical protein [Lactococcus lactis]
MKLSKVYCKECGGILNLDIVSHIKNSRVVCPHCHSIYIYEAKHSDIGAQLELDAERMRLKEKQENIKEFWKFKKLKEDHKVGFISLLILFSIPLIGSLVMTTNYLIAHRPGQIELPISEKKLHGENYKNVESKFEDMGFENIKYEKVRDLKFGLLAHSGDVSEVTINGDNDFKKGDNYNKKSKIKIYYHVFPK